MDKEFIGYIQILDNNYTEGSKSNNHVSIHVSTYAHSQCVFCDHRNCGTSSDTNDSGTTHLYHPVFLGGPAVCVLRKCHHLETSVGNQGRPTTLHFCRGFHISSCAGRKDFFHLPHTHNSHMSDQTQLHVFPTYVS